MHTYATGYVWGLNQGAEEVQSTLPKRLASDPCLSRRFLAYGNITWAEVVLAFLLAVSGHSVSLSVCTFDPMYRSEYIHPASGVINTGSSRLPFESELSFPSRV